MRDADPAIVDDVIWGCVSQVGEQTLNVGRNSVLAAGWPESVPATTVDRQCGSSQQAAHFAAAGVLSGQYDVAVAGGVESMTRVPMFSSLPEGLGHPYSPRENARYHNGLVAQGISSEIIAQKWGITREDVDRLALISHERAAAAIDEGRFKGQLAPIEVPAEGGRTRVVDTDEGVRRGGTLEGLAQLKSAFQDGGVTTAANSSQISDGAGAMLIMTSAKAADLGLTPLARFHSFALAGVDPITMLSGPIPATRRVLERAGLSLDDIGAYEVNEAFGTVVAAWLKDLHADPAKLNPNGGAMALGHPLGGTGAILMTKLVHHMVDNNIKYGLQAVCEGGGTANATILELL
jgi:acetyl-CoA acyltransferase